AARPRRSRARRPRPDRAGAAGAPDGRAVREGREDDRPSPRREREAPRMGEMSSPREVVVAVDGGGSKTDVVVASTSGDLIAHARGPGSNPQVLGLSEATRI